MKTVMTQAELKEMVHGLDTNDSFVFTLTSRTQEGMEEIMDSSNIYTSLFPETVADLDIFKSYGNTDEAISEAIELGAKLGYIYGFIKGANAHVEEYIESEEYTDYLFEQAGIC